MIDHNKNVVAGIQETRRRGGNGFQHDWFLRSSNVEGEDTQVTDGAWR
jgi:hypothetical protein